MRSDVKLIPYVGRAPDMSSEGPVVQVPVTEV